MAYGNKGTASFVLQLKLDTTPGKGRAGLDIGTSTAAVVSEKKCTLTVLGAGIESRARNQRLLQRKLEAAGGTYHEVNTVTFRASQYNHETDTYRKKKLSDHHCTIHGQWVQRDLYSAFLLMNSDASLEHTDRSRCIAAFETFLQAHNTCISENRVGGIFSPLSHHRTCRSAYGGST